MFVIAQCWILIRFIFKNGVNRVKKGVKFRFNSGRNSPIKRISIVYQSTIVNFTFFTDLENELSIDLGEKCFSLEEIFP